MSSVLQQWLMSCPWKMQSIVLSGLRGPDHALLPNIKKVGRWMRMVTQNNADPSKDYMKPSQLPFPSELEKELEHSPCHFVHHFADALAVIAYNHPDAGTRTLAFSYYYYIAEELFHFIPEPPAIFAWRHRDKPNGKDRDPFKPCEDREWVHEFLPGDYVHDHPQYVDPALRKWDTWE